MKKYTIFTKDELWEMLDGKEVVFKDKCGTCHVYISEERFDNLKYADDEGDSDD
jgi:uncharacterized protein YdeI (BOF family)